MNEGAVGEGFFTQFRAESDRAGGGNILILRKYGWGRGEDRGHSSHHLAAKLDDEEVNGVLQDHSSEPFEEAGDAFLLKNGGEAVSQPLVPRQDGRHLHPSRVEVVDDAPGALEV